MLTALILICSTALTPDLADCNRTNAVDALPLPNAFANRAACFKRGHAYVEQGAIEEELGSGERAKVLCIRRKNLAQSPGLSAH